LDIFIVSLVHTVLDAFVPAKAFLCAILRRDSRFMPLTNRATLFIAALFALAGPPAFAGPPYVTDDPEPTDTGHYEIYAFTQGNAQESGSAGESGIDFNYGGATDLQLTAVIPLGWSFPSGGGSSATLGNIELAAKYKFLHQDDVGVDVAVFPRVFLPAGSPAVGARNTQFFLPVWIGRSWDDWSTFGGGCSLNHGYGAQNFCQVGWVLTKQVLPNLQLGAEIYHQSASSIGGRASTYIGAGGIYDLNEHYHLMVSAGPGIQNSSATGNALWYVALLTTF
jgi:hypothetical protein